MSLIRPSLNLEIKAFDRTKHGIRVIGTWHVDDSQRGKSQPCLVLLDAMRPLQPGRTVPIVILMNDAWKFAVSDDRELGDRQHATYSITEWIMENLLPNNVLGILDAINDSLRDLYNMPPKPREGAYAIGDLVMKDSETGETIKEVEITNRV